LHRSVGNGLLTADGAASDAKDAKGKRNKRGRDEPPQLLGAQDMVMPSASVSQRFKQ